MVAQVRTVAFHGVEVVEVETQVTIASGLPAFTIVGRFREKGHRLARSDFSGKMLLPTPWIVNSDG